MDEYKNNFNQPVGFPVENWSQCPHPSRTDMTGRYCKLKPFNIEEHAESLFQAYASDNAHKNWTYLPYGPFEDYESFHSWLNDNCTSDDPLFYSIINLKNESVVGMASFLRIQPIMGVIEVGHIHYSPLLQQTAMSTEAMYLMMHRVFEELKYRRYEWKCDALNEKSRKAAVRLGFSFEGIFRQATMYKGRNRDTAWYSIIDTEWPILNPAFTSWLDPSNFDSKGLQRTSLSQFIGQNK